MRRPRYPLAMRPGYPVDTRKKKNPLTTSEEIGIGALVLLGLGGLTYYLIYANRNVVVGLKITGYCNKTQNGPVIAPGVTLEAVKMDVITVYVQWSYHGQQQINYTLEADVWTPYTGFHLDWWNSMKLVDKASESVNLDSSLTPKTYYKSVDVQLSDVTAGDTYSLGAKILKPGSDYYSLQISNAIKVTSAPPASQNGFTNITVTPKTTEPIPTTGGSYEFTLAFDYSGNVISNFTVMSSAGYTNPGFQVAPGATYQTNPQTLDPGHYTYDITIPISAAAITWLQKYDPDKDPDLDILIAYKLPMQVVKLYRTYIPVAGGGIPGFSVNVLQPATDPDPPVENAPMTLTATVVNAGNVEAKGTVLIQIYEEHWPGNILKTQEIYDIDIPAGGNKDLEIQLTPDWTGKGDATITVTDSSGKQQYKNNFAPAFSVSSAPSGSGGISGEVYDSSSNSVLPYATVIATDAGGTQYTGSAGSLGEYTISNLPPGAYTVTCSYSGYENYTGSVTVDAGQVANLAIDMTPLPPQQTLVIVNVNPAGAGSVTGAGLVDTGSSVTIAETPSSGYSFVNWTDQNGNVVSTSASYSFEAIGSTETFVANFSGGATTPEWPAPGTVGDGQEWVWCEYSDDSWGWLSLADYNYLISTDPSAVLYAEGPYPSGATS